MAEIRYRCEVAEKKRARSALERFQKEKSDALQKAAEEAEKNKQEALKNLTETLARKLRNEAALQRELAVSEALAVARVILNVYVKFISSVSVQGLDDSVYKCFNFYFSQEKCRASSTRINRRNKTRMRKKICCRSVKSCAGPPEQSEWTQSKVQTTSFDFEVLGWVSKRSISFIKGTRDRAVVPLLTFQLSKTDC